MTQVQQKITSSKNRYRLFPVVGVQQTFEKIFSYEAPYVNSFPNCAVELQKGKDMLEAIKNRGMVRRTLQTKNGLVMVDMFQITAEEFNWIKDKIDLPF